MTLVTNIDTNWTGSALTVNTLEFTESFHQETLLTNRQTLWGHIVVTPGQVVYETFKLNIETKKILTINH